MSRFTMIDLLALLEKSSQPVNCENSLKAVEPTSQAPVCQDACLNITGSDRFEPMPKSPLEVKRPHHSRSSKYSLIDSGEHISDVENSEYGLKNEVKFLGFKGTIGNPYGKHVLRFSTNLKLKDDSKVELLCLNSHDGSKSYEFMAGIYRLVCGNGLILGSTLIKSQKIRHVGYTKEKVNEAVKAILTQLESVVNTLNALQDTQWNESQEREFIRQSLIIREVKDVDLDSAIKGMRVRRPEDSEPTAWNIFNRVQEYLTRGFYCMINGEMKKVKAIKAVTRDVKMNRRLFDAAMLITRSGSPSKNTEVKAA